MRRIIDAFTPLADAVYRARLYQRQYANGEHMNATTTADAHDAKYVDSTLCLTLEVPFEPSSLLRADLPPTMRIRRQVYNMYGRPWQQVDRVTYCTWWRREVMRCPCNEDTRNDGGCMGDCSFFWCRFLPYWGWWSYDTMDSRRMRKSAIVTHTALHLYFRAPFAHRWFDDNRTGHACY